MLLVKGATELHPESYWDVIRVHLVNENEDKIASLLEKLKLLASIVSDGDVLFNPYPTAFPYGNGMVLHFYQQQESSTTKTVHKVINKGLKTYV